MRCRSVKHMDNLLRTSMSGKPAEVETPSQTGTVLDTKPETKRPSLYKVLMLNDDFTPMDFVVHILQRFFHMNIEQATDIMLQVHQNGVGLCGVFTYEIAETKVVQVTNFARKNQHPLQCTMEKA